MKTARKITLLSLVVLCCLILFGCGKDDEGAPPPPTAPDKPTVEVNVETAEMDVNQLRAAALKCKAEMKAKIAESDEKAQELIKSLGSDKPEGRAKLSEEMAELNKAAEALGVQLEAYIAQLKEKGGDVSGLELDQ
jgi:hypothetical protein